MADYYPLVARAVEGLEKNTGEARRSLYDRAREALVTQLRSVTPALSESEITRERIALEEAIRKVEAEQARKARLERPSLARPALRRPGESDTAQASPEPPTAKTGSQQPMSPAGVPVGDPAPAPSAQPPPVKGEAPAVPTTTAAAGLKPVPPLEPQDPPAPPPAPVAGGATGRPPPRESPKPAAPGFGPGVVEPTPAPPPSAAERPAPAMPPPSEEAETARLARELDQLAARYAQAARGQPGPDAAPAPGADNSPVAEEGMEPPPPAIEEEQTPPAMRLRSSVWIKAVVAVIVLAVLGTLGALAYRERASLLAVFDLMRGPQPPSTREQAQGRPKIEDRIGPSQLEGAAPARREQAGTQLAPHVAQRVVLYEEDPKNPAGRQYLGSVIWRTETVSPGPGLAPELAVRALVEVPERKVTMALTMVRNTDPALPASHTVDIRFTLPQDSPSGSVASVPGILMKQNEQARGVPLAGLAVKVTENVFLIGLSAVDVDVQRNTQLLRERPWFDVPIVYSNGSRAILAMEKGTPGERAFQDAFTAWGRSGRASR